jgi:hypothetical protein
LQRAVRGAGTVGVDELHRAYHARIDIVDGLGQVVGRRVVGCCLSGGVVDAKAVANLRYIVGCGRRNAVDGDRANRVCPGDERKVH